MSLPLPALPAVAELTAAVDLAPLGRRRRWRVRVAAALGVVALVLLPAAAASAHVRVIPDATSADGFAKITFRVPNESATAGTTKIEIALPTDAPFTSVAYLPAAGWTAQVVTGPLPTAVVVDGASLTEAPVRVVWTADSGVQIVPGAFQEFSIVAGPLPAAGTSVLLPATQTYSDGSVVVWDQVAKDGAAEPEFPAPILVAPAAEDAAATPTPTSTAPTTPTASATSEAGGDTAGTAAADPVARWLGGLGLVFGAAGLALVVARRGTRQVRP